MAILISIRKAHLRVVVVVLKSAIGCVGKACDSLSGLFFHVSNQASFVLSTEVAAVEMVLAHDLNWDFSFRVERIQMVLVVLDPTGEGSVASSADDKLDVLQTVKNFAPMIDFVVVLSISHLGKGRILKSPLLPLQGFVVVQVSRGELNALGDVSVDVRTNASLVGIDHAGNGVAWVGVVVPVVRNDGSVLGRLTDARDAVSVFKESLLEFVVGLEVKNLLDGPVGEARRSNDESSTGVLPFFSESWGDLLDNDHLLGSGSSLGLLLEARRGRELHGDLATIVGRSRSFVGHGEVEVFR